MAEQRSFGSAECQMQQLQNRERRHRIRDVMGDVRLFEYVFFEHHQHPGSKKEPPAEASWRRRSGIRFIWR